MKKRHSSTLRVMKELYPNKRMTPTELHLSTEEISVLKRDVKLFGGINITYRRGEEIECVWLSSNGRKYIEQHDLLSNIKAYLKSNYKWIIATVIALVGMLFFGACSNNREDKKNLPIGKYVYMDSQHILHIKKKCVLGMQITNAAGNNYYKAIDFIDTIKLTKEHIKALCTWCVEDEHYSQLERIANGHEEVIDYMPGLGWGNSDKKNDNETDW